MRSVSLDRGNTKTNELDSCCCKFQSGGYKISSLDIERVILGMSKVKECAVVGIHDEEYGERIAAIVVLRHSNDTLTLEELQEFCSKELARYKLPTRLILLQQVSLFLFVIQCMLTSLTNEIDDNNNNFCMAYLIGNSKKRNGKGQQKATCLSF